MAENNKEKPWFRLYTEVVDDPKVQMLPGDMFKQWINLLCIARKGNGLLHRSLFREYSWTLRLHESALLALVQSFVDAELLDTVADGSWMPHGWDKRQYESDSSTKRVQEFRARKKQGESNVSDEFPDGVSVTDETQQLQRSGNVTRNVSVTPPETETETETETEERESAEREVSDLGDAEDGSASTALQTPPDVTATKRTRKPPLEPDDAWIASLVADPAYVGVNVSQQVAKCRVWCVNNHKLFSRRRIVNWLNNAEPSAVPLPAPTVTTPPRKREFITRTADDGSEYLVELREKPAPQEAYTTVPQGRLLC